MGDIKKSKPIQPKQVVSDVDSDPPLVEFTLADDLTVWFDDDHPNSSQSFKNKTAMVILRDLIQGKITTFDATRAVLDMLPSREECLKGGDNGWNEAKGQHAALSQWFCDMAMQIPYNHRAQAWLVQLLVTISRSERSGGMSHGPLGEGYPIFVSMEQFGIDVYEQFEPDIEDDLWPGDPVAHGLNSTAFLARLSLAGFPGFVRNAFRTMRNLESEPSDPRYTDLSVSTAALRVLYGGQTLYIQAVEAPVTEDSNSAHFKPGKLYKGPQFGIERWAFWKEALKAAGEKPEEKMSEQSRKLAAAAAELMEAIEKGRRV
ncbi:hypothetical protein B0H66DRAFT_563870 [Apodospora peruviana]|uniref:Uncharacterized protein n=1 Tax=Apodospora peruviana TaxID=516989 RepID=A0AAE0M1R8_9PEZI|nr:hypothetical protein B0H66DRAFT_563870 [Apodospora peruviana]